MTPEQEKMLLDGYESTKSKLAVLEPLAAKVPDLEKTLAAKDLVIADLQKGHQALSRETAIQGLKTKYPNVPVETLEALPENVRDTQGAILEKHFASVKAVTPTVKTDPRSAWADVGGIGPTNEAEAAHKRQLQEKAYDEAGKSGNVMGMLQERGAEIAAHVRRALTPRS